MLNILLKHIKLPTNDHLLWDNLTTLHSVYYYANLYTYIYQQLIAFVTCLLSALDERYVKEKREIIKRHNNKQQQCC